MRAVHLGDAHDARAFGGKAAQLAVGLRAGLPVPDGFALDTGLVEAVARGDERACAIVEDVCTKCSGPWAVRSSAVGEDSANASFAGQHRSVLNVRDAVGVRAALRELFASARTKSALAYRKRIGVAGRVRIAAIIQHLVDADVAGVLFSRNPVTGADELVVEASWGLGEAIVQGQVIPDLYRIARSGNVLEQRLGSKTVASRRHGDSRTRLEPVAAEHVRRACLSARDLRAIWELARRCDEVFNDGVHDLEWAFAAGTLALLQRRPVTTMPRVSPDNAG